MDPDSHPDNKTIWDAVMQARMDLAELKVGVCGFESRIHFESPL